MKRTSLRERGFSLMEMLVVVAIIGALMLVTVPNFIVMRKLTVLKGGMRQYVNDMRGARARAVSKSSIVRVAYEPNNRKYCIFESTDEGTSWNLVGNVRWLPDNTYFANSTGTTEFKDTIDDTIGSDDFGALPDVIFERNGVARSPGGNGQVLIKATWEDVPKHYTVSVRTSGMVSSQ